LKEIFSADFDVKLLSAAERSALGQEKPKKPTSLFYRVQRKRSFRGRK